MRTRQHIFHPHIQTIVLCLCIWTFVGILMGCGNPASPETINEKPHKPTKKVEPSKPNPAPSYQHFPTPKRSKILGNWLLKQGWFPDKNLTFQRSIDDQAEKYYVFHKDGTFELNQDNYKPKCPVGDVYIEEGNWHLKDSTLTLEIKGNKVSDYAFWYKVEYELSAENDDRIHLTVLNILKNQETKP